MATHDISIIRPQLSSDEIKNRGTDMTADRLKAIKKGLRTLHTLELMATNVYKFQISSKPSELNRHLTIAMCNEMTHYQDFQTKLYEFGFKPCKFRWAFWLVGLALGFTSKLLGEKAIYKTGIWVESKAVAHYAELLKEIDWDDDTRAIIEKDQADEDGHISTWKKLLDS